MPKDLMSPLLDKLVSSVTALPDPYPRHVVFVSATDGERRAQTRTVSAESLDDLREKISAKDVTDLLSARLVRLDWVTSIRTLSFESYTSELQNVKRNYSRKGLSLDATFRQAVTEAEINGNALLYKGTHVPHCEINQNNFDVYWKRRFGKKFKVPEKSDQIYLFQSKGLFQDNSEDKTYPLTPSGRNGGHREFDVNHREHLEHLIQESAAYLADQVKEDGLFHYGWHPCFDRPIQHYNTLRHASSTYALCEAYGVAPTDKIRAAIERSLRHITKNFIKHRIGPSGACAFLMDVGNEVKLGGNAVAILALCKMSEVTGDRSWLDLACRLGRGILSMQREDGGFRHILDSDSLTPKEEFRIVYYDGEAAFALMRLYEATKDERWIEATRKAVAYFMSKGYWNYHDHWLAYCINELSRHDPNPEYIRFGIRNVQDYLDFIRNRITTFPTLLELCCATRLMIQRSAEDPATHPILDTLDLSDFKNAMETRAQYLTNGFFFPEVAMYFRNPPRITGGFFIRHHGFRVRIDDVEHYLSGLIAYRDYLDERDKFSLICEDQKHRKRGKSKQTRWTSTQVASLLKGATWLRPPVDELAVDGLSLHDPSFRKDDIVLVRQREGEIGISPLTMETKGILPKIAIVGSEANASLKAESILQVSDMEAALLTLAEDARQSLTGKVIGVTGSAGKTSVTAMISHCLAAAGRVYGTRHGANMVPGIAWNLCCVPRDTEFCVLEMAIGRMKGNSALARPDVAVFTNIHPAHLIHHRDTATIARRKSNIFMSMPDSGVAVLNRDMNEYEIVASAAREKNLRIVTYGQDSACDIHPSASGSQGNEVEIEIHGTRCSVPVIGAGDYAIYNSMAVAAALYALNVPIEGPAQRLQTFSKVAGRGQSIELPIPTGSAQIIDHSYNANLASMQAALDEFRNLPCAGRRILVLGQMAELGEESRRAHIDLLQILKSQPADVIYLLGEEFRTCMTEDVQDNRFRTIELADLDDCLLRQSQDGDLILVKGSFSTGLYKYLDKLRSLSV